MARVTVEDCLKNVDNRFDLVLKSAKRAHELEMGASNAMVDEDNDKPTVIALREIAEGYDVTRAGGLNGMVENVERDFSEVEEHTTHVVQEQPQVIEDEEDL